MSFSSQFVCGLRSPKLVRSRPLWKCLLSGEVYVTPFLLDADGLFVLSASKFHGVVLFDSWYLHEPFLSDACVLSFWKLFLNSFSDFSSNFSLCLLSELVL